MYFRQVIKDALKKRARKQHEKVLIYKLFDINVHFLRVEMFCFAILTLLKSFAEFF